MSDTVNHLEVKQAIIESGLDVSDWHPNAFDDLTAEVQRKECELLRNPLRRSVNVIKILARHGSTGQYLIEENVVRDDGREQFRGRAPSEKLFAGERPSAGAIRGLVEELSLPADAEVEVESVGEPYVEEGELAKSYPRLWTIYTIYPITCVVQGVPDHPFVTTEVDHGEHLTHHWSWTSSSPEDIG
ncbi:MAG: hypothetical protein AAF656_00475 [Planctomycetota bacterium]